MTFINIILYLRKKLKQKSKHLQQKICGNYRPLQKPLRKKPIEIWAFIRAKNEIITIETSLNSILPTIQKGVIGYNKCPDEEDDGTEQFILQFCKDHPGFIPCCYPYDVKPAHHEDYQSGNVKEEHRLDTYYNAVFQHIPEGAWFMKIDCDHVFDTEKFQKLPYLIKEDKDIIALARMNFHYDGKELSIINIHTIVANGEWLLLKKENLIFRMQCGHQADGTFFAWERLERIKGDLLDGYYLWYTDLFNWHFPFMKTSKHLEQKYFTNFDDFIITEKMKKEYHISEDMLDKNKILSFCYTFRL